MSTHKLTNDQIDSLIVSRTVNFPKYASTIINRANSISQATRPKHVGQMTELIQEFPGHSFEDWTNWYRSKQPDSIENATQRIMKMIDDFQQLMPDIDEEMVREWVEDLVLVKTFTGLRFQEAIFKYPAEIKDCKFRMSTPEEESRGIDGFLDDVAYSIKPMSYIAMSDLAENIDVRMILYTKTSSGIKFEFD